MTREQFLKLMEFEDYKIEWVGDNAFEGLKILSKYTDNLIQGARRDIIYSEDIDMLIEKGITKEEVTALRKLNWMVEDESYLACFV